MTEIVDTAMTGFEVGGVRIVPLQLLIAVLVFLALVLAIRLAKRWLTRTVLAPPRVDPGVAHSVATAFGYAGFALAALIALSVGGADVSNLAIIAGALSVGIGFGLQSIVNNFVSGLILLVERPVKVGDRISVKGHEGIVRRIGVRASEIETADQARLILPNSDLITEPVTNATSRMAPGRVSARVGVVHAADPDHVLAVLDAAARTVPMLSPSPAPVARFEAIGETGLEFSVEGHAGEGASVQAAETQLRCAIVRALREAEIELARSHVDVRLRDLDFVRAFMARAAAERARRET